MCFEKLGSALASLHKITESQFGFSTDNYIGTIKQCNIQESNWVDFFYLHRIEPHVKWCYDEKLISRNILCSFENMYRCLHELFPVEVPALLHGDLWTGNQMNTPDGPAVYDPAVYYGHREMDIAMTRLFGGFGEEFYISYNNEFPLEKDYVKRTAICNLYPLLVHVKLFGTAYLPEIITTVKRF
jgi:fructosamine-3-kinase